MRRIKTLGGFALLALAAMLTSNSDRHRTYAAEYSCKLSATCPGSAKCEGTIWTRTGDCSISCYKELGLPGEVVFNGSANCGASSEGRSLGDGPPSN